MPIYDPRPRGKAQGDLSGSYPAPKVINLSGSATGSFSGSFIGSLSSSLTNIIDTNSTGSALRVTQRGTGNALLIEDTTNPDSSPFIVDNTGKVGIGTLTPGFMGQSASYALQVGDITTDSKVAIGIIASASRLAEINFGRSGSSPLDVYRGYISYDHVSESLSFGQNGQRAITISGSQNIGIGTLTPETKLNVSGAVKATSFTGSFFGDLTGTASYANNSDKLDGYHANAFAITNSVNTFTTNQIISGNLEVSGTITANQFHVTYVTSSVLYQSGSTKFGDSQDDTHTFTGSVNITGSISASNNITASVISASQYYFTTGTLAELNLDYIDFNTASVNPPFQTGRVHYGTASGDLEYDTDISGVTLKIGQQTILKIKNNYGSTLSKGMVVRFSGSNSSDTPFATTASWVDENQSAHTIGIVMENIDVGANGYVILEGILGGLNTSAYNQGDLLFLSSSGLFSNTPPPANTTYHGVRLGQVVRVQNGQGSIFVKVDNGYELGELHDVRVSTATEGDLLILTGSQWKNSKILTGSYTLTGSLSASNGLTANYVSGTTLSASAGIAIDGMTLLSSSLYNGSISASHGIAAPFLRTSGYLTVNGNTTLGDSTAIDVITVSGTLNVTNRISSSAAITASAFSGSGAGLTTGTVPTASIGDFSGISGSVLISDGTKWTSISTSSFSAGASTPVVSGTYTPSSPLVVTAFATSSQPIGKYIAVFEETAGGTGSRQMTEFTVTHSGSTPYITQFNNINANTGDKPLVVLDASINGTTGQVEVSIAKSPISQNNYTQASYKIYKIAPASYAGGASSIGQVKAAVHFDGTPVAGAYQQIGTVITCSISEHGMSAGQYCYLKDAGGQIDGYYQVNAVQTTTNFTVISQVPRTTGIIACERTVWVKNNFNILSVEYFTTPGVGGTGWVNTLYRIFFTEDLGTNFYYPMCSCAPASTYNNQWAASIGPAYFYTPAPQNSGMLVIGSINTYPFKSVSVVVL